MTLQCVGRSGLIALFFITLLGCTQQQPVAPINEARRLPPASPLPPRLPSETQLREYALALGAGDCGDLKRIRHLAPKAGQLGSDDYYDRIYTHPAEYHACLVESISDATPIPPIHSGPGLQISNVGDMAYHMLGDMHAVPPNDAFRRKSRRKWKREEFLPSTSGGMTLRIDADGPRAFSHLGGQG